MGSVMQPETPRRATYEDLLAVPDTKVAELLDGELFVSPLPAVPHAHPTAGLFAALVPFRRPAVAGEPGGWWILFEPELHLGEDVLVPDVAGWRLERLPALPAAAFITTAPDWVCEVLSPGTARHDRGPKMRSYAAAAVAHLWLVDPIARTIETHRLGGSQWMVAGTHDGTAAFRAEPFEELALDPTRWWLDAPPA